MRASVTAAWPVMCQRFEGRLSTMYCDTKGLVTTGTGNLIDSVSAAQALPWLTKDNKTATPAQIEAEWRQIKARQSIKSQGGYAYVKYATLHLDSATLDRLLSEVTATFWTRLARTVTAIETFPADAQLALIDLAWQNGPAFLDAGTAWTGTRAAVLAQNWTAAASHVPGTGTRADARKRLFNNAAAVVKLGIDPEVLWDTKVPMAPVNPAPPITPPVIPPEEPDVSVAFRGGRTCSCVATSLPAVEKEMIRRGLIKNSIDVFQYGYRNDVGASAGTHAAGGCTDVAQYSDAQIQCWRDMGWTMQHRTPAQGFSHHAHGWPLGCTHLAPDARSQASQWANRTNGLVSRGPIAGKWPIDDWKTALKKWQAAEKRRADAAAAAAKEKELELPTTAEVVKALTNDAGFRTAIAKAVVNTDGAVKNTFTGNPDNPDVAVATALEYLGSRSKKAEDALVAIQASLDALTARFPGQPPAA